MSASRLAAVVGGLIGLVAAQHAVADELSAPLTKAEAAPLVVDKKLAYVRKRDGARQAYDFKGDGTVYFTTSTTARNTSFYGTYALGDDGAVCFKWNPDKYLVMQDGCMLLRRDGDKLVIVGQRNPGNVIGEVAQ